MSDLRQREPTTPRPTCTATTKHGERAGMRCGMRPIRGGNVCHKHGGGAPQVRAKAISRLNNAVDTLAGLLLKLANSAESEQVRLAAIKDALDRAGLSARQAIDITLTPFEALTERIMTAGVEVEPDDYIEGEVVESRPATAEVDDAAATATPTPTKGKAPTATLDSTPPRRIRRGAEEDRGKADLSR